MGGFTIRRLLAPVLAAGLVFATAPPAGAAWPEQWWLTRLDTAKAWTVSKGAGVTVAVIDTGVVPVGDLSGRVLPGVNLVGSGDGRSDPGDGCKEAGGCYSHGTQMALLIAGTAAGKGFQGIAPEAKILPVKVSPRTGIGIETEPLVHGIRWAVDHGADVINIAIGSSGSCPDAVGAAIKYAYQHDVIVVVSSGNDGSSVMGDIASCPGALAVGATDPQFSRALSSNYGPLLDFVDPGTPNVQETESGAKLPGGRSSGGTSDSAAIASGTFALIRSHFPHMSARDVVTHALWNVHNGLGRFGVRINDELGYGEILPYHAMADRLPTDAANPIYDRWAKALGPPTTATSAPVSDSATSGNSATSASSTTRNSSLPAWIVPAIAGALVVGVLLVVMAARARRRGSP